MVYCVDLWFTIRHERSGPQTVGQLLLQQRQCCAVCWHVLMQAMTFLAFFFRNFASCLLQQLLDGSDACYHMTTFILVL